MTEDTISDPRVAVRSKTYASAPTNSRVLLQRLARASLAKLPRPRLRPQGGELCRSSDRKVALLRECGGSGTRAYGGEEGASDRRSKRNESVDGPGSGRVGSPLTGGRCGIGSPRPRRRIAAHLDALSYSPPAREEGAAGRPCRLRFPTCSSNRTCGFRVRVVAGCPQRADTTCAAEVARHFPGGSLLHRCYAPSGPHGIVRAQRKSTTCRDTAQAAPYRSSGSPPPTVTWRIRDEEGCDCNPVQFDEFS